jgi:predicted transcriptional regulator
MIGNHDKWVGSVEHAGLTNSAMQAVAQVAAAFATRSTATVDDIVSLTARLASVFASTNTTRAPAVRGDVTLSSNVPAVGFEAPAIPVENAVSEDKVFCLCCGRGFTMLKRHLKAEHGLSEEEYRSVFDLHEDIPLVAPNYSARKAAYAKRVGLGKYNRDQEPAATG